MIIVWKWTVKTGRQKSRLSGEASEGSESIDREFAKYFVLKTEKVEEVPENDFLFSNKFEIPVYKEDDRIIGFTKEEGMEYDLKEIKSECEQYVKNNQVLIMLHSGYPDSFREIPEVFNTKTDNIKTCLFGGGKETIYESLITETGLFRGEAITKDEKGNWLGLSKEKFNIVWNYYWWKDCKKKLYELKEDLLINLYPYISIPNEIKIENILNIEVDDIKLVDRIKNFVQYDGQIGEHTIKNIFQFDDFWSDFESEGRRNIYKNLKTELEDLIEKHKCSKDTVYRIRTNFNQLITTIPTLIY